MDSYKLVIIIFLIVAFCFTILAIMSIAYLQKYNKKITERSGDRRMSNRRNGDRRSMARKDSDRRSCDRRLVERRVKEGSIFDRKNIFENFSPGFSEMTS